MKAIGCSPLTMLWLCSRTFDSDYFVVGNGYNDEDNDDDEVIENKEDKEYQGVVAPSARAGQPPLLSPPAAPDQQGAGHEDRYQERLLSLSYHIIISES